MKPRPADIHTRPADIGPRPTVSREQRTTIIYGIMCAVLVLVILQLWLITATMNAYLGGDYAVVWPAAGVSVACLILNLGLLRYLYDIEKS
jgi:hypothetical protein